MPVTLVLDLPEDPELPPLQVHVFPAQAKRLTKTERECHRPARTVPAVFRHVEDVARLVLRQRLYLNFLPGRFVDQSADVPGDDLPPYGELDRARQDAVDLHDRVQPEVLLVQIAIEGVQVFRSEPIKGGATCRLYARLRDGNGRAE
ncbi:hypothetical protein [Microbispora sp. CA-102843]|uniref:hypothetical protein n=1 Tax=Microbispora sp. CA-102843 TaxID=3239952 RepID=UPI003D8B0231